MFARREIGDDLFASWITTRHMLAIVAKAFNSKAEMKTDRMIGAATETRLAFTENMGIELGHRPAN